MVVNIIGVCILKHWKFALISNIVQVYYFILHDVKICNGIHFFRSLYWACFFFKKCQLLISRLLIQFIDLLKDKYLLRTWKWKNLKIQTWKNLLISISSHLMAKSLPSKFRILPISLINFCWISIPLLRTALQW